jgi:hypothetical protein
MFYVLMKEENLNFLKYFNSLENVMTNCFPESGK